VRIVLIVNTPIGHGHKTVGEHRERLLVRAPLRHRIEDRHFRQPELPVLRSVP